MPLIKIKQKGQITIPKKVRDEAGLSEGDVVDVAVRNGQVLIIPQRLTPTTSVPKLSANEQQMLDTVKKKIQAINTDVLNSKGLTQAEAQLAAKVGIIDPDQIWFWLENWQEGHREAERDILEGRKSGPFETADELFAHLQKQTV